jgi:Hemerythrin HHE cation binding domain
MDFRLDMSMMFAMHDALPRELAHVGRIAGLWGGNPGALLHAARGWELFKKFLLVHHQSEDDTLWPALRAPVAGQPGRVALADPLEAEHAAIEPLLTAIDAAAADPDHGYQRFGDITGELAAKLTAHLAHEESDGLPLTDASLTLQEWQRFAQVHASGSAATRRCTCPGCSTAQARRPWTRPQQVPPGAAAAHRLPRGVGGAGTPL